MKYKKCPVCELNYIEETEKMCDICKNKSSSFDDDEEYICPICYKNKLKYDEVICKKCMEKRLLGDLNDLS
ncbi:MAG TPA: hypothetical protein P5087_02980 [Eubacteriales bacterium]|nr:hypothetical protein [Clostridia bacterium]HRX13961.1 hypothetical protein [Eubacteriales bacterium]